MLTAIGYWRSESENDLPEPSDFIGQVGPHKHKIVEHLCKGLIVHEWKGFSWCRLGCDIPYESMGNTDLSDGVYIWPEGLAHYIERHRVQLPDRFVQHILEFNRWPGSINPYEVRVDFTWWKSYMSW